VTDGVALHQMKQLCAAPSHRCHRHCQYQQQKRQLDDIDRE
jgi:hypothetical protein